MLVLFIVFMLSVVYYVYFRSTRKHLYELSRDLPSVGQIPVLGHTHWFIGGPERILNNIEKLLGKMEAITADVAQVWIGPTLYAVILNPEDIQTVLEKCLQKDGSYKFLRAWLGNGLFVAPVDLWKEHRRILLPVFNNRIVENYIDVFGKHCEVLVQRLEENVDGAEFDVFNYVTRCSLDIVFETSMGERMDLQRKPDNTYVAARNVIMSIISMRLFKAWLQLDTVFNLTPYAKLQKEKIDLTHHFTDEVIRKKKLLKENISTNTEGDQAKHDILDMLMNRANVNFSDEQLREHIDSITIAGNDTTSLVVAYALVLLGSHSEEQDKVYSELKQIFGDSKRIPTKEDLNEMKYMDLVLKEAMRLYTVVPVIGRETQSELKLSNCTLPAGVGCAIVPYMLHRSKKVWGPDADSFRPDRFLPENSVGRHPCAFIPFSHGARNCIGRHFGMLIMKSLLASILRTYEVSAKPCGTLKIEILLVPVEGHMISLKKRCLNN